MVLLQKTKLNGNPAVRFNGVYFYYPANCDFIQIPGKKQNESFAFYPNKSEEENNYFPASEYSEMREFTPEEYREKYGKFNDELGVYIGEGIVHNKMIYIHGIGVHAMHINDKPQLPEMEKNNKKCYLL
jgi:hypothetical protein